MRRACFVRAAAALTVCLAAGGVHGAGTAPSLRGASPEARSVAPALPPGAPVRLGAMVELGDAAIEGGEVEVRLTLLVMNHGPAALRDGVLVVGDALERERAELPVGGIEAGASVLLEGSARLPRDVYDAWRGGARLRVSLERGGLFEHVEIVPSAGSDLGRLVGMRVPVVSEREPGREPDDTTDEPDSPRTPERPLEVLAGAGPDRLPALESNLGWPTALAFDGAGNLHVLADQGAAVFRIDPAGELRHVLSDSRADPLGGVPLRSPLLDVAVEPSGPVWVVAEDEPSLVRFDPRDGSVTSFDTGSVTPQHIAIGPTGDLWVAATDWSTGTVQVHRFRPETGEWEHVAGCLDWEPECFGPPEGRPAIEILLAFVIDVAVDAGGSLHILQGSSVLRVDGDGIVHRVAGGGPGEFSGDGGPADQASFRAASLGFDAAGNLYLADGVNHRIRRVDTNGIIDTVAGNGQDGSDGDGGPALDATLSMLGGLAVDPAGRVYVTETRANRVRVYDPVTGVIDAFAGNGTMYFSGDGHPAAGAGLSPYVSLAEFDGAIFVCDVENHRVRRIDPDTGIIQTFAGTGDATPGVLDDGVPALDAVLPSPRSAAFDSSGNLFLVTGDSRIRRIDAITGRVSTVPGVAGERIAFDPLDRLHVSDGARILRVDPSTGASEVFAGGGSNYYDQGIPATQARLQPASFGFDPSGDLYIIDYFLYTLRKVDAATGRIYTISSDSYDPVFLPHDSGLPFPESFPLQVALALPTYWVGGAEGDMLVATYESRGIGHYEPGAQRVTWHYGTYPRIYGDPPAELELGAIPLAIGADGAWYLDVAGGQRILVARDANEPPVADAGASRSVSCSSRAGARVALDGSGSFDPDAVGIDRAITHFIWYEGHGTPAERRIAAGPEVEVDLPIGAHSITLLVRDRDGGRATDTIEVVVVDDADPDGDGVGSCVDVCPALADPLQADTDGNGLGDACDPCFATGSVDPDADGVCGEADNCPERANAEQGDADSDGIGDACDACPSIANPEPTQAATCFADRLSGSCRGLDVDPAEAGRLGWIRLSRTDRWLPDQIVFTVYHSGIEPDRYEFFLNGVTTGIVAVPGASGTRYENFVFDDPVWIASAWRQGQDNEFRFRKLDTTSRVTVARARAESPQGNAGVCLYSYSSYSCSCARCGSATTTLDVAASTEDSFFSVQRFSDLAYGPEPLTRRIPVEPTHGDSTYRLCVSATPREPSDLYGSTIYGDLYRLDGRTGDAARVGELPSFPRSMAWDPAGGTAVLATSHGVLQRFDPASGIGGESGQVFAGPLEWLSDFGGALHGIELDHYGTHPYVDYSRVRRLDLDQGTSATVARIDEVLLHGLLDDPVRREVVGLKASGYGGSAWLVRVDLDSETVEPIGSTSHRIETFDVGPDGMLYGLEYGPDGRLYRIDSESAVPTLVAETGIPFLHAILRTGPPGTYDCVEFRAEGEDVLALNASCGPPVAAATAPATAECASEAGATIVLDGTGSTDPNSTPGTSDAIVAYDWFDHYGEADETPLGSGATLPVALAFGEHRITLRVTNRFGESATDALDVAVVDTVPPSLTVVVSPSLLWPPNHELVEVEVLVSAADACGAPDVTLVSVASSEPDDAPGGGDGATTGDVQGADAGTADFAFELRAERAGSGPGRTYTFVYSATDRGGNAVEATTVVVVPHDAGGERGTRPEIQPGQGSAPRPARGAVPRRAAPGGGR